MPCQPQRLTLSYTPSGTALTWSVNTSTNILTFSGTAPPAGTPLKVSSSGTLPTSTPQIVEGVYYYVINPSGSTAQLAATIGGSAINFTTVGTGTHSATGELLVILQKHPSNVARVSLRAEENRTIASARTAVGRLKAVGSAYPQVCRWTVEAYGTLADKAAIARILRYQETDKLTPILLKDEVERMEVFNAAQVASRVLVGGSLITAGLFQAGYYVFQAWANVQEEPWFVQEGDEYRFILEFRERY